MPTNREISTVVDGESIKYDPASETISASRTALALGTNNGVGVQVDLSDPPMVGQQLVAITPTHAMWQTPASGSDGGSGFPMWPSGPLGGDQTLEYGYTYLVDALESSIDLTLPPPDSETRGFAIKVVRLNAPPFATTVTIDPAPARIEHPDGTVSSDPVVFSTIGAYEEYGFRPAGGEASYPGTFWRCQSPTASAASIILDGDCYGPLDANQVVALTDSNGVQRFIGPLQDGQVLTVQDGNIVGAAPSGGGGGPIETPVDSVNSSNYTNPRAPDKIYMILSASAPSLTVTTATTSQRFGLKFLAAPPTFTLTAAADQYFETTNGSTNASAINITPSFNDYYEWVMFNNYWVLVSKIDHP